MLYVFSTCFFISLFWILRWCQKKVILCLRCLNVWVFPSGCRKFITKMAFTVGFSSAIVTQSHTHKFEQIGVSSVLASQALTSVQWLLPGKLTDHWSHTMESHEWVTWFARQERTLVPFHTRYSYGTQGRVAKFCPLTGLGVAGAFSFVSFNQLLGSILNCCLFWVTLSSLTHITSSIKLSSNL